MDNEINRILDAYKSIEEKENSNQPYFGFNNPVVFYRLYERYYSSLQMLHRFGFHPLSSLKILDVGCANGVMLREFVQWGAQPENLFGIELRESPVEKARKLSPNIHIECGSANAIPWPDMTFDLVCLHTVLTSILDQGMREQVAREVDRVIEVGGAIFWYDFIYDNPRNNNVRGMRAGEIKTLFKGYEIHLSRITLAPPIANHIPKRLIPSVYPLLSAIPFLRTHYLGLFIKKGK